MTTDPHEHPQTYFVVYTDGGSKPNPGYAGLGVFGYICRDHKTHKNIKHPHHASVYFTPEGILKEKTEKPVTVEAIYEESIALGGSSNTNNLAEIKAILRALTVGLDSVDKYGTTTIKVYTDSSYIANNHDTTLSYWVSNNWKRTDNGDVAHQPQWKELIRLKSLLEEKNVSLTIEWIKGHAERYGNHQADYLASIGVNGSRYCHPSEDLTMLSRWLTFKEYKDSYPEKDFIYDFKHLYFNSDPGKDDINYCFLYSGKDIKEVGKKSIKSLFALNKGYVPPLVNRLKEIYRSVNRDQHKLCVIKFSKFADKDVFRLLHTVDPLYALNESSYNKTSKYYSIVGDPQAFITELDSRFPFIVNISSEFNNLFLLEDDVKTGYNIGAILDITNYLYDANGLKVTSKDTLIDLTDAIPSSIKLLSKPILVIDNDIPSYLTLKHIEPFIEKVELILVSKVTVNEVIPYVHLKMKDRSLYSHSISQTWYTYTGHLS